MNDETSSMLQPSEDDIPTQPVAKPADGWTMPEPVFRQSSGGTLPRRLGVKANDLDETAEPAGENRAAVTERSELPASGGRMASWLLLFVGVAIAAVVAAMVLLAIYLYFAYRAEGSGF